MRVLGLCVFVTTRLDYTTAANKLISRRAAVRTGAEREVETLLLPSAFSLVKLNVISVWLVAPAAAVTVPPSSLAHFGSFPHEKAGPGLSVRVFVFLYTFVSPVNCVPQQKLRKRIDTHLPCRRRS